MSVNHIALLFGLYVIFDGFEDLAHGHHAAWMGYTTLTFGVIIFLLGLRLWRRKS